MASGGIEVRVVGTVNTRDFQRVERELNQMRRAADTLDNKIRRVGESFQRAGRKMRSAGTSISRYVTAPAVALGTAAIRSAADFESSFAKIEGLVGVAGSEIDELREAARRLGPQMGVSANEAAEALFFITSAGLRGSDAIETLESSLKASAIGLGETAVVADLATSALNAYGSDTLSAAEATDVLTNAVRLGKLEPGQLSAAMGQVLPVASAMGVSFDQVGAAFAAMSRTGTDANVAATQLRQIMATLLKPTVEAEKALAGVGLSAEGLRQQVRDQGLLSVLQTLIDRFDGNAAATTQVFGNIRALSGVLDLMGSNADVTAEIFDGMTNSLGVTDEAFAVTADTANFKFKVALEELRGAMIDLGGDLIPIALDIAEAVRGMVERFQEMNDEQQEMALKMIGIVAVAGPLLVVLGQLVTIIGGIATLIGAIGLGAFAAGIFGVGIAALTAYAALKPYNEEIAAQNRLKRDQILLDYEGTDAHMLRSKALLLESRERSRNADASRYAGQAAYFEAGGFDYLTAAREEAAKAAEEQTDATEDQTDAVEDAIASLTGANGLGPAMVTLTDEMRDTLQQMNEMYVGTSEAGDELAEFARDTLAAGVATAETERTIRELGGAIRRDLSQALADAEQRLSSARSEFESYRDSLADGIRSGNTLADAARDQQTAIQRLADAERDYAAAQEGGDPDAIAEAAERLEDAKDAQRSFTEFLSIGADTARTFGNQIDALRLAGASLEVTQQIAALGAQTGGRIVEELLAGGAAAIEEANRLVAVVEAASLEVANAAAEQFYGAGVRAAQALVDGLRSEMDELDEILERIVEKIGGALERKAAAPAPAPAPAPVPGGGADTDRKVPTFDLPPSKLGSWERRFAAGAGAGVGGLRFLAEGGLVTGPTLSVIGEAGPELVVPLDRAGEMGGKTIVNVTVTSADPQAVVEALRKYTRGNGPLGATVTL